MKKAIEHNEATLSEMIARRYCAPEWAYLPQVRNGTGFSRATARTADGIAMSLWPSRGIALHGFEIKVSRSDWLHELSNPQKADEIAGFCDRWWLVVANDKIVRGGELPGTWGLYVAKGDRLYCEVEAKELDAKPFDKLFVAAVFRRMHETMNNTVQMRSQYERGMKEGTRLEGARLKGNMDKLGYEIDSLKRKIEVFEKACGIDITKYSYHKPEVLAKAFRIAVDVEGETVKYQLRQIKSVRDRLTEIIENVYEENPDLF